MNYLFKMEANGWRNRNVLLYVILKFLDMAGWGVWGLRVFIQHYLHRN